MAAKKENAEAPETKGFAVYDHTLQRYITGVLDKEAAEAVEGPEGHQLEVREV